MTKEQKACSTVIEDVGCGGGGLGLVAEWGWGGGGLEGRMEDKWRFQTWKGGGHTLQWWNSSPREDKSAHLFPWPLTDH